MRPTDLHFRSPREKTAEFLYPLMTSDGRLIPLLKKTGTKKGSFPQSQRFPQYSDQARKTGYRVGPGAYEINQSSIGKAPIKGTPSYHKIHGEKDYTNNGYIYVGNSVVFDPGLMNKTSSFLSAVNCAVDASSVVNKTPQSKSKRSIHDPIDSSKKVPWYMKYHRSASEEQTAKLSQSFFSEKNKRNNEIFMKTWKNSPKFD